MFMKQFQNQMFTYIKSFYTNVTKADTYTMWILLLTPKQGKLVILTQSTDICNHFSEPSIYILLNLKLFTEYMSVTRGRLSLPSKPWTDIACYAYLVLYRLHGLYEHFNILVRRQLDSEQAAVCTLWRIYFF